ncbi:MAG: hypothetical protein QOJ40_2732 [Verrucomicrobiota bacterium]
MEIYEGIKHILGLNLEPRELTFIQISLRGIIVFSVALVMVRAGARRFLAKMSAFDAILGFILASMLARAINGSSAFFPTLGAGFVIVGVHRLLAILSFRSDAVGQLLKGRAEILVQGGKPDRKKMESYQISEQDLLEEARLNSMVEQISDIRTATIERNGQVSVIPDKES